MKASTHCAFAVLFTALAWSGAANAGETASGDAKASPAPPVPQPAPRRDLAFRDMDVTQVLKAVADANGLKIIFAGVVQKQISLLLLRDVAPEEAIQEICKYAGLRCFRIAKTNTFVIGPLQAQTAPSNTRDGFSFFGPGYSRRHPGSNWRSFEFNGVPFYMVPLSTRNCGE